MSPIAARPRIAHQPITLSIRIKSLLEREAGRADFDDDDAAPALTAALAGENLDWAYSGRYAGRRELIKIFRRDSPETAIFY